MYLVVYVSKNLLHSNFDKETDEGKEISKLVIILISVEVPFWLFNFVLEFTACSEGVSAYFEDPWNYIDVSSIVLQAAFLALSAWFA